ncbi:MAG TPA: YidC/Oxa1 family membrane protein insertase [Solirubrobacterales bacterium]|jgi:YidC/Oxa1 family membrane protein insertase|nr:YidC/Oxa1 family membrane protein insertase [Solirubrobacterales bacterium]
MTPLTANILQPLIDLANGVLQFFHDSVGLSWGMSIIALTVVTRAVLIPLTYKQLKGMRALQALQPQIKELQEKYKNDKQRMQQEMMRFYKENEVNPLASCLPLIAQFPVFISLFFVLKHELPDDIGCEAGHCGSEASFLFIHDLTAKATGGELIALIVLYVGTQLVSSMVMMITADKSQRTMMLVLPFIFVPFILSFPAGLILYWITTNFWTIGQQLVIKRIVPPPVTATPEGAAAIQEAKAPPPPPRKKKKRR